MMKTKDAERVGIMVIYTRILSIFTLIPKPHMKLPTSELDLQLLDLIHVTGIQVATTAVQGYKEMIHRLKEVAILVTLSPDDSISHISTRFTARQSDTRHLSLYSLRS